MNQVKSHVVIYGKDLNFLKSSLSKRDYIDLEENPDYEFIPGERYLVMEKQAYDHITKVRKIHLGPRSENISDIVKMDYLLLKNGVIMKFAYYRFKEQVDWLDENSYKVLEANLEKLKSKMNDPVLRTGVSKKTNRPWYMLKHKVIDDEQFGIKQFLDDPDFIKPIAKLGGWKRIRTGDEIRNAFKYLNSRKVELYKGFDYETNNIPFDDRDFFPMGLGISDDQFGVYFDIEWMMFVGKNLDVFLDELKKYLDIHQSSIYTYNVGFELRVTYWLLKVLYDFHDAAAINIIEGNNFKRFSLKYTSMRYNHVPSWDKFIVRA